MDINGPTESDRNPLRTTKNERLLYEQAEIDRRRSGARAAA